MKRLSAAEHQAPRRVAYLVCGLGNPGGQYAHTRHNIGFMAVDELAKRERIALRERSFLAHWGRGTVAGAGVALAKPQTFMNRSGGAVVGLLRHLRLSPHELIVIHDDLDLKPGRLRIRPRGGTGGHRGIESIIQALATDEFTRIRVGIGRPVSDMDPVDHVLSEFQQEEEEILLLCLEQVTEALRVIVSEDAQAAMNRFNAT